MVARARTAGVYQINFNHKTSHIYALTVRPAFSVSWSHFGCASMCSDVLSFGLLVLRSLAVCFGLLNFCLDGPSVVSFADMPSNAH